MYQQLWFFVFQTICMLFRGQCYQIFWLWHFYVLHKYYQQKPFNVFDFHSYKFSIILWFVYYDNPSFKLTNTNVIRNLECDQIISCVGSKNGKFDGMPCYIFETHGSTISIYVHFGNCNRYLDKIGDVNVIKNSKCNHIVSCIGSKYGKSNGMPYYVSKTHGSIISIYVYLRNYNRHPIEVGNSNSFKVWMEQICFMCRY